MADDVDIEHEPELAEPRTAPGLDRLLAYLNESRGFDFEGYKRAGLERRLVKRLRSLQLETFEDYVDYLEVHPDEFDDLFNAILINATSFFRDSTAWDLITQEVVPQLVASKKNGAAIRVWSAGCATGQEPYSIAMVLAQALGLDAFMRQVKIYATDMDDEALTQARQGLYTVKEVAGVPPELLASYFERAGTRYAFSKEVRRGVIFGRHDLLHDAPISRIDLLLCRNTLMYFNTAAQARILSSLHFALAEAGVLVLGKAEMLLSHSTLFAPLDLKRRVFTKVTHRYPRGRLILSGGPPKPEESAIAAEPAAPLSEALFDASPIAQVGLSTRGIVTLANERARSLFELSASDVGKHVHDTSMARKIPGLRGIIDQTYVERRNAQVFSHELERGGEVVFVDIVAAQIADPEGNAQGVHFSFIDVTTSRRLQKELQQATHALEGAYEELQATSEELETTNEELQSTVEELETTNEELQSTNEELETTNEELQSTNEELQGMNETLRVRTRDLGRVNLHFELILASLRSAVVVVGLDLHVQVWSSRATDMWGLRGDEVIGKHFFGLDIGLPVEELRGAVRACIAGERDYQDLVVPANNRRGKPIQCAIKTTRLSHSGQAEGVILLMDEQAG